MRLNASHPAPNTQNQSTVLQQLIINPDMPIYYWSAETGIAELDFVVQRSGKVIPIEVKAEKNLQAKSLKSYYQKYNPEIALRTSMSDYREEEWLINIPLYGIGEMIST